MGIITDQTKERLNQLSAELKQIDYDIFCEKQRIYSFLAIEDIENYLQPKFFANRY